MALDGNTEESGGVAAVERAFAILEAFDDDGASLSLAELSKRTGFYKSTILRLIQSLERFSYIVRGEDGRYRIGPGAWRVGALFLRSVRLEERIAPLLRDLTERTEESASFYIPVLNPPPVTRVCLLRVDSPHAVRDHVQVGARLPLDVGAGGRVLRAFLDPIHPEDEAIRRTCVHASWGERDAEIAGVAAPVLGADRRVVGALTLSAPTSRRDRDWVESMTPVVLAMADRACRAIGGPGLPTS